MGLLNSALQIGRSAILSYQGALQTVGNNISNAANPDYARLSPDLVTLPGAQNAGQIQPGAGVALSGIQRNIDEALEGRIRLGIGAQQSAMTQQQALSRVESVFNTLGDGGISDRLSAFFSSFDNLQNSPEDVATRDLAVTSAAQLADSLRTTRQQLAQLGTDLDGEIANLAVSADDLAGKIGKLNEEITRAEAGGHGQATGLRDQRDGLLRNLSEIFDVTVREQPNGAVNVYIGSEALVQGNFVRHLTSAVSTDGDVSRTSVRFADTNAQIDPGSGRLAGLITSRDQHAFGRLSAIDELAAAVIAEVNGIHADGQGLVGFRSVTGTNDLLASNVALDSSSAGLKPPPRTGSFFVTVLDDETQTPVSHRIDVNLDGTNTDTTLDSLVTDFNAQVDGVTASVTSDQRIAFTADDGRSFVFGFDGQQPREDTSHVLAALGINTLFSGHDATDIAVNETVTGNSQLLAASSAFLPGDGTAAGRLAALDTSPSGQLGRVTLGDSFNAMTNAVAVAGSVASDAVDSASTVLESLQTQRENISGVNLDEEAISLLKFERAFQGTSRFVSVVDNLLNELVLLIR